MPCQDDFPGMNQAEVAALFRAAASMEERQKHEDQLQKQYQEKLNSATRAACDLSQMVLNGTPITSLSEETIEWMKAHAALDAERLESEYRQGIHDTIRRKALAKLDQDERKALGL